MSRHFWFYVIAGLFALIATGVVGYWYSNRPTVMSVAVGPPGAETDRIIRAFERSFAGTGESVRFRVLPTQGAADSARAIDSGAAQLAILRSDADISATGQTVAILNRRPVTIAAKRAKEIEGFVDLRGKRVGVVTLTDSNRPLFERLAASFDMPTDAATIVELDPNQAADALVRDRVDALFLAMPAGSAAINAIMGKLGRELGETLRIVGIESAGGIATRYPGFEAAEVPQGAFGGTPARPLQTLSTVAIAYRLVARRDVEPRIVADVARAIDEARITLSRDFPLALRIEIPEPTANAGLPVHPGAAGYLDGENYSFFDAWGDIILYVMWGASMIASAIVAGIGLFHRRKRETAMEGLDGLVGLLDEVKLAPDLAALEQAEREAEDIYRTAIAAARRNLIDADALTAYRAGVDEVRRCIADRRGTIARAAAEVARAAAKRRRGPVAVST